MIYEKSTSPDYRSLVVDNWCVVAEVSQPEDCDASVQFHDSVFDIDSYRILKSFIDTKRHKLAIQPISLESLNHMGSPALAL
jgi:hypothetical protein